MSFPESTTANEVRAAIAEMGQVFDLEVLKATYALFTPLQERAPKEGVEAIRDVAYGDDARQQLDLFVPAVRPDAPAPVVVYVHGGGFIAGERSPVPGLIYDNVATFFARHGMIGVNATYRLAPAHRWPSGAADVGAAIAWLKGHAAELGGDPARIFAIGQSAGATHVAAWAFIEAVHGPAGPGIAGAVLLSGSYAPLDPEFSDGRPAANNIAYYGEDLAAWRARSPLYHVRPGHPPVFVCVAEYDPYPLAWPSAALATALAKCDRKAPRFRTLAGHNHVSPAMQINAEIDALGPDLLDFIGSTR